MLEPKSKRKMKNISGGKAQFKDVLKKARLGAGLTSSDLARKAGIHLATYSAWELGRNDPSLLKFQPVIAALGEHARPLLKEIGYAP